MVNARWDKRLTVAPHVPSSAPGSPYRSGPKIGRASSTIRRTCSAKSSAVVSSSTASSAGRSGATARVESAWSRAASAAASASSRAGSDRQARAG